MKDFCPFTFIYVAFLIYILSPLIFFDKVQDSPLLVCFLIFRTVLVTWERSSIWCQSVERILAASFNTSHILSLRTWDSAVSTVTEDQGALQRFQAMGTDFYSTVSCCSLNLASGTKWGFWRVHWIPEDLLAAHKLWSAHRASRLVYSTWRECSYGWHL